MDARVKPGHDAEFVGTRAAHTSSNASLANSAFSWMNSKRASALEPISRSTAVAVVLTSFSASMTRSSMRLLGSMVVSFNCAAIISPRPLKRLTSTLALALKSDFNANAKVEVSRFKGLGEMMAAQLKETTMDPGKRMLLRVVLAEKDLKATATAVERLMGSKAEARFEFIQEKAEFASEALLDV